MAGNSLEKFIAGVASIRGPVGAGLVDACRRHLEQLLTAPAAEAWLAALRRDAPADRELYRDPAHGFVLLAHTEPAGLYRRPHDHGRSWVIYAVLQGEIEMGSYARTVDRHDGATSLVKTNATLVRPGQVQVYLAGDIHDTRCVSGPALLLRFTERDLKKDISQAHRVTRYVEQDGAWIPEAA